MAKNKKAIIRLAIIELGDNDVRLISSIQIGDDVSVNTINPESFFGNPYNLGKKYGNLLNELRRKKYEITNGEEVSFEKGIVPIQEHKINKTEEVTDEFVKKFKKGIKKILKKKIKKPG